MAVEKVTAALAGDTEELTGKENVYSGSLTAPKKSGDYSVNLAAYDNAGNVTLADSSMNKALAVEVSLWHTPRTDWKATDRFNTADYNRIKNNLVYLHEKAVSLCRPFEIMDMGEDMESPSAYWKADSFNLFESNLEKINRNIFTKDYGYSHTFFINGPFIRYDELNRIESAILSMNEILERQKAGLRHLSFRLGTYKEVKI